jgi:2-hydroxychromene-2-carboxylate isomerase
MGDLISLTERLKARSRPIRGGIAFFFALDCPLSYIVAERVERELGDDIAWVPVLGASLTNGVRPARIRERFELAAIEANGLRLPLIEPHSFPSDPLPITRACVYASDQNCGRSFALAAMRMAFCGGYDLSDEDVIAEAADVANLEIGDVLAAAADPHHEGTIRTTVAGLRRRGITSAPAIRIAVGWFHGIDAVMGTAAFTAARDAYHAQPEPASQHKPVA